MQVEPYYKWTKKEREMYLNGCGPGPIVFNFIFKNDCYRHDYYYTVGTTSEDRYKADVIFLKDMKKTIKKHGKHKWFYTAIAYTYYFLVRVCGYPFFTMKTKFKKK